MIDVIVFYGFWEFRVYKFLVFNKIKKNDRIVYVIIIK